MTLFHNIYTHINEQTIKMLCHEYITYLDSWYLNDNPQVENERGKQQCGALLSTAHVAQPLSIYFSAAYPTEINVHLSPCTGEHSSNSY